MHRARQDPARDLRGPKRDQSFVRQPAALLAEALEAGWATLHPWPTAFRGYLDDLIGASDGRKAKAGLANAYGPLAASLMRATRENWTAPLLVEMVDRLVGHPEIALRATLARRHGSGLKEAERHLTLAEAAERAGLSPTALQVRVRRIGLGGVPEHRWGQHRFRQDDVDRLKEDITGSMTQKEAAEALGLSRVTFQRLAETGARGNDAHGERSGRHATFRRGAVSGLLEAMELAAQGKPRVDGKGTGYRELGVGGSRDGLGTVKLVSAVLAGRLRPAAVLTSGAGLSRYLFPRILPKEVRDLLLRE